MIVDLSPILKVDGGRIPLLGTVDVDISGFGALEFTKLPEISGVVANIGNTLEFEAEVVAEIKAVCDRCGESAIVGLDFPVSEVLKKHDEFSDESDDFVYFTGLTVDLAPIVSENLLLNIPMKILCSEDCRGLCPKCGKNLNVDECGCDDFEIDPRFDVLKDFFEK